MFRFSGPKAGEAEALGNLSESAKSRIFPVIKATASIPVTFQPNMIAKLPGFSIALDGAYNLSETGSPTAFISLFNGLGMGGLPVIPAMSVNPDGVYLRTVTSLINKFGRGLVIQTSLAELPNV